VTTRDDPSDDTGPGAPPGDGDETGGDGGADMVRVEVSVPLDRDRAFALFTDGMAGWWPTSALLDPVASVDPEAMGASVSVDHEVGGVWSERSTDGSERRWGAVRAWDPPAALRLDWVLGADRTPEADADRRSVVDVRFAEVDDDLTTVIVEHRGLAAHGSGANDVRRWVGGDDGWWAILSAYAAAARA